MTNIQITTPNVQRKVGILHEGLNARLTQIEAVSDGLRRTLSAIGANIPITWNGDIDET